ncbi:hypothetical protein F0562_024413 [Nyssa sinensis]|uniref:Uncharacterized protein n=1 Tax=Nyssa sinensis TaxID=561372 RepID=A0A5J5BDC3_9ASTE|nr:hypothetical protein F0562_024413 [Nyssa sinensis]
MLAAGQETEAKQSVFESKTRDLTRIQNTISRLKKESQQSEQLYNPIVAPATSPESYTARFSGQLTATLESGVSLDSGEYFIDVFVSTHPNLFCKNIVLAGVVSLTLIDDRPVTKEALSANFLIAPDENFAGRSIAELCCDSLKDFNRMKLINGKCRKSSKRVAFYTVDCRDSCGEFFVDLQNYTYSMKNLDEKIKFELLYPSFQNSVKAILCYESCRKFEKAEGRNPGETSIADLPNVLKLRKELCETHSLNESQIPVSFLERLVAGTVEFPPEVIKVISGKGDPLKNFFFFDALDGKGMIEDMSNTNTEG